MKAKNDRDYTEMHDIALLWARDHSWSLLRACNGAQKYPIEAWSLVRTQVGVRVQDFIEEHIAEAVYEND